MHRVLPWYRSRACQKFRHALTGKRLLDDNFLASQPVAMDLPNTTHPPRVPDSITKQLYTPPSLFYAVQVQVATGCSLAYVTDDATMVGFPFDDACQEMTV